MCKFHTTKSTFLHFFIHFSRIQMAIIPGNVRCWLKAVATGTSKYLLAMSGLIAILEPVNGDLYSNCVHGRYFSDLCVTRKRCVDANAPKHREISYVTFDNIIWWTKTNSKSLMGIFGKNMISHSVFSAAQCRQPSTAKRYAICGHRYDQESMSVYRWLSAIMQYLHC